MKSSPHPLPPLMIDYKLYIPGPVDVSPEAYQAMSARVMGHRSPDFVELYQSCQPQLQELFQTKDPVFLSTSSAWGVMEGAIRNLCAKKTLCCMCGAFSDKWLDVARRCGKPADGLQVEWGSHIDPQILEEKLSTGEYDVVTLVHNETSCGMMNPLEEIMEVLAKYPDVLTTKRSKFLTALGTFDTCRDKSPVIHIGLFEVEIIPFSSKSPVSSFFSRSIINLPVPT